MSKKIIEQNTREIKVKRRQNSSFRENTDNLVNICKKNSEKKINISLQKKEKNSHLPQFITIYGKNIFDYLKQEEV